MLYEFLQFYARLNDTVGQVHLNGAIGHLPEQHNQKGQDIYSPECNCPFYSTKSNQFALNGEVLLNVKQLVCDLHFLVSVSKLKTMKRLHTILILLLGFSYGLTFSQESPQVVSSREAKKRIVPGIKIGINRSNVYDEEGLDFVASPKTGFVGGAYVALPIGSLLGIQPEILISQKGFSSHGMLEGAPYYLERTTTFLDVPLQVQLKLFRFLTLLGGVQYSFLMKQTDSFSRRETTIAQSQAFENDNIRKNILGGTVGFDINIRHIVLSGRSAWDFRANRGDGSYYTPRYKNVWLQATIGYRFY
jgi:hypothetical protein